MTILVLAHKRFLELPLLFPAVFSSGWFLRKNRRGLITILLSTLLFSAVAGYLAGLYFTFQLGLGAKDNNQKFAKLRSEIAISTNSVSRRLKALSHVF